MSATMLVSNASSGRRRASSMFEAKCCCPASWKEATPTPSSARRSPAVINLQYDTPQERHPQSAGGLSLEAPGKSMSFAGSGGATARSRQLDHVRRTWIAFGRIPPSYCSRSTAIPPGEFENAESGRRDERDKGTGPRLQLFPARPVTGEATGSLVEVPAIAKVMAAVAPFSSDYVAQSLEQWLPEASARRASRVFDAGLVLVPDEMGFQLYSTWSAGGSCRSGSWSGRTTTRILLSIRCR